MQHEIFKSKRFWTAMIGLIVMLAVNLWPELEANADLLTNAVLAVIGILIGGYTLEDMTQAKPGRGANRVVSEVEVAEAAPLEPPQLATS